MDEHTDELFEIHARFCSVFSNAKRLKIMWLIGDKDKSVGDIAKEAGLSESSVSQHLRVMRDAGLVIDEKRGYYVHYRLNEQALAGWREEIEKLR